MVTKILYFGANQYVLLATTKISFEGPRNLKEFFWLFFFFFFLLKTIFKNLQGLKVLLHFFLFSFIKSIQAFWLVATRK